MWKSGFFLRAATKICPQGNVEEFYVFHRHCGGNFSQHLSTGKVSTIHSPCGKIFNNKKSMLLSCARQESNQRNWPKGALRANAFNCGMIATGNHCYFDSLRGAPPPLGIPLPPYWYIAQICWMFTSSRKSGHFLLEQDLG